MKTYNYYDIDRHIDIDIDINIAEDVLVDIPQYNTYCEIPGEWFTNYIEIIRKIERIPNYVVGEDRVRRIKILDEMRRDTHKYIIDALFGMGVEERPFSEWLISKYTQMVGGEAKDICVWSMEGWAGKEKVESEILKLGGSLDEISAIVCGFHEGRPYTQIDCKYRGDIPNETIIKIILNKEE